MVFGGFDRVMDGCTHLSFPALRLAIKLNLKYPVWFDETFPQDVLQKGVTPSGQVAQFCEQWKSHENFCIPLVLEVARRDQQNMAEFVQTAEDTLIAVFKTANSDPNEWEAMEILFEQYIENLNRNKFYADHEAFLAKMSAPLPKRMVQIGKVEQERQQEKAERRAKAIDKSIEENYYCLINTVVFKGEMAARLVQYQVITMAEKQLIESSCTTPEAHARMLILNFIRKRPEQWNAFIAVMRECYSADNLAWALMSSYNRFMELLAFE